MPGGFDSGHAGWDAPNPPTSFTGKVWDWAGAVFNIKAAGAIGDGITDVNCAVTSGTTALSTTTNPGPFIPSDTGRAFTFAGAGVAGAALKGTATYVDSQHLTLSVSASTTVTPGTRGFAIGKDNADAINVAQAAANALGGGLVLIPNADVAGRGYYVSGTPDVNHGAINAMSNTAIRGSAIDGTTLYGSVENTGKQGDVIQAYVPGAYFDNVSVTDLTIDCSAQYVNGTLGGLVGVYSNALTLQSINNAIVERIRVIKPFGFGVLVGVVGGATTFVKKNTVRNVYVEGGSRNGNDAIGGGGIWDGLVEGLWVYPHADGTNPYGTAMDWTFPKNVTVRQVFGLCTLAAPTIPGWQTDYGADGLTLEDIFLDGFQQGIVISSQANANGPAGTTGQSSGVIINRAIIRNTYRSAIAFNSTATFGVQKFAVTNCIILSWDIVAAASPGISLQGGHNGEVASNIFGPVTTAYCIRLAGDAGSVVANPPTWIRVHHNDMSLASNTLYLQYIGATPLGIYVKDNAGLNPVGGGTAGVVLATPAFPATTVAIQNTFGVDTMAYITNGTAALSIVLTARGTSKTITVPANGTRDILWPANETLTPTYAAGAPTWVLYGL